MRKFILKSAVAVAILLACEAGTSARLIESWPYEKLFKESDLVVIADAVKTEDCADRDAGNPWKIEFVGQNTSFKVHVTLKGKVEGDELKVLHFRLPKGQLVDNGPLLVSFRTTGTNVNLKHAKMILDRPEYMLFLKAGKDGRFEPVSGRVDPEMAVKEMHAPMSHLLEKGAE